jgi:hypothetical protein
MKLESLDPESAAMLSELTDARLGLCVNQETDYSTPRRTTRKPSPIHSDIEQLEVTRPIEAAKVRRLIRGLLKD